MLSAGQVFFVGRKGENTYLRGDLNALNYSAAEKFGDFQQDLKLIKFGSLERVFAPESLENLAYEEIPDEKGGGFGLVVEKTTAVSWLAVGTQRVFSQFGSPFLFPIWKRPLCFSERREKKLILSLPWKFKLGSFMANSSNCNFSRRTVRNL